MPQVQAGFGEEASMLSMNVTLHLRLDETADYAPVAWFFPGHNAAGWMEELAWCGWAEVSTSLFLVGGRSVGGEASNNRSGGGLLVVPGNMETMPRPRAGMPCRL